MKSIYLLTAALIFSAAPSAAQEAADAVSNASETTASQTLNAAAFAEAPAPEAAPLITPAVAPADEPKCELHIWPAERFQAMTTGWLGGGLLDAAIHADGDKARRSQMASALDTAGQLDALQKLDLIALLKLPASKIIVHDEALDRKTVYKIMTRRSESKAPCYSELIVTDVLYTKAAMWGRSLRTSFILRDFASGTGAPKIKKTTGGNGLKIFPAKKGDDTTAADAELVSIFQKNFTEAAENFAKQAGSTS